MHSLVRVNTRAVRGAFGYVVGIERRRAPLRRIATARLGSFSGAISPTVMRTMVAAADELRLFLAGSGPSTVSPDDLTAAGTELADLVRRYQGAVRQLLRDWLKNPRQSAWLVDSASGRTFDVLSSSETERRVCNGDLQISIAEDQPLYGLRKRHERAGVGIPVVAWRRRTGPPQAADIATFTAAHALTAVISVEPDFDRRVRCVRIILRDPVATSGFPVGGVELPLAADFTAPVAQTMGRERRPAANPYGVRDMGRRGTVDGFVALTPFAAGRAPLIVMEGTGLSPVLTPQITNAVAGDSALRDRYQVWVYRFPIAAPFFYAARQFRSDLEQLSRKLEATTGNSVDGQCTVVAHGAATVLAKALLVGSGSVVWDAVFATAIDRMHLDAADRALLESLLIWSPSTRVGRVIVVDEPRNSEALLAGVGVRTIQLLMRQPLELRAVIERVYGSQRQHLRSLPVQSDPSGDLGGLHSFFPEPVCDALAGAALGADRALLTLLEAFDTRARDGALLGRAEGEAGVESELETQNGEPLGPITLQRIDEWLRSYR